MQLQSRVFSAVASRSGASLVFVLAIMLLLMAVGASALVAASAAAGTGLSKQAGDRLDLYAESLHKSIMYSLLASENPDPNVGDIGKDVSLALTVAGAPQTLGGQLLKVIYEEALLSPDELNPDVPSYEHFAAIPSLILTPALTGGAGTPAGITQEVKLSINPHVRVVKAYTPEYPAWDDVTGEMTTATGPPVPREASISAEVMVRISVVHQAGTPQEKSLISVATYRCTGALLTEDDITSHMKITKAGDWKFVSYEKIDR